MGLGGRREKQIITADPRNTRWLNDTSSPGHRLLAGMGYDPANANSSENKTGLYGHESSKRLKQIPIAKGGMEGIGFKTAGPGADVAGALPTRMTAPGSLASAASTIFSKLGSRAALQFVTAGASKEVINKSKTEGGEFGGLLARLNAAAASASATPEPSDTEVVEVVIQESAELEVQAEEADDDDGERRRKKQRKLEKAAEKAEKKELKLAKKLAKASRKQGADSGTDSTASTSITPVPEVPVEAPSASAVRMQHWNASRSRNLRAKRMLHASADAMAEILGIAPTPSPSVSGYSTPSSLPATIPSSAVPSTSAIAAPQETPKQATNDAAQVNAEKLRRKAERKAAKALQGNENDTDTLTAGSDTGKELKKKKRKRET